jgi:hypothetical protein
MAMGLLPEQRASKTRPRRRDPRRGGATVARKSIRDLARELVAGIPEEDLRRLPVDGASEHGHYLYGTPKKSRR